MALRDKIRKKLNKVSPSCPTCGGKSFALPEQPIHVLSLQDGVDGITIGGGGASCAVLLCEGCGLVSLYALKESDLQ